MLIELDIGEIPAEVQTNTKEDEREVKTGIPRERERGMKRSITAMQEENRGTLKKMCVSSVKEIDITWIIENWEYQQYADDNTL